jgi:hypothetical protein
MVSRATIAASLAMGLSCQMKAIAFGTIPGERSILHTDPNSHDPAAAYPLVTAADGTRLRNAKLAEDYDGEVPSNEELADRANAFQQEVYEANMERFKSGQPVAAPPAPPLTLTPLAGGDTVTRAAANKVGEDFVREADQSVPQATGLDYRQTTHFPEDPNKAGLQGNDLILSAGAGAGGATIFSKTELEETQQAESEASESNGPFTAEGEVAPGTVAEDDPDAAPAGETSGRRTRRSSKP